MAAILKDIFRGVIIVAETVFAVLALLFPF